MAMAVKFTVEQQNDKTWDITFFDKRNKELGLCTGYPTESEARHYAPIVAAQYLPSLPPKNDRR
jgi:hypothetical protein